MVYDTRVHIDIILKILQINYIELFSILMYNNNL